MYKIGIVGSKDFLQKSRVLDTIIELKNRFGLTPIIMTGGNLVGAEQYAKNYALEAGMKYKEYNPSFTGYRLYSALDESYYGKAKHISHYYDRYKLLVRDADYLIFFQPPYENDKLIDYAIKQAEKMKKKFMIIK